MCRDPEEAIKRERNKGSLKLWDNASWNILRWVCQSSCSHTQTIRAHSLSVNDPSRSISQTVRWAVRRSGRRPLTDGWNPPNPTILQTEKHQTCRQTDLDLKLYRYLFSTPLLIVFFSNSLRPTFMYYFYSRSLSCVYFNFKGFKWFICHLHSRPVNYYCTYWLHAIRRTHCISMFT